MSNGMADAVYGAQSLLAGSVLDVYVTPGKVAQMIEEAGLEGVKVKKISGSGQRQAFAVVETNTLYFAPAALTMPIALHEIAHLLAGPEHGPAFVNALCELVHRYGSRELADQLRDEIESTTPRPARIGLKG